MRQSVVGYSTDSVSRNSRICQAPTFDRVDGTTLTLTDLTLVGGINPSTHQPLALTRANHNIKFFSSTGNMQKIKEDTTLEKFCSDMFEKYKNTNEELMFIFDDASKNWYMQQDDGFEYPMNDYPLEKGRGYLLYAASGLGFGAKMTFSGQVGEGLTVHVGRNSRVMVGNICACDKKLSEFTIVGGINPSTHQPLALTRANHNIKFFGSDGNMQKIKNETALESFCSAMYNKYKTTNEELMFIFDDASKHWYLQQDDGFEYPMDNYVIKAGRGMIPYAASGLGFGMDFTMPAAIQKPVEFVEE